MTVLHVPVFGGGVVLEGSADAQRTDELQACESYDIGARGQLVAASDVTDYVTLEDDGPGAWERLHLVRVLIGDFYAQILAVGEGLASAVQAYVLTTFGLEGATSPVALPVAPSSKVFGAPSGGLQPTPLTEGVLATFASVPGTYSVGNVGAAADKANLWFVNLGARDEGLPLYAPGLYVLSHAPSSADTYLRAINYYDALGTGDLGVLRVDSLGVSGGTKAKQLRFRGIAAHNGYIFGWGFDETDGAAKASSARVMFSNANNPLKWGNDNAGAVGIDRDFTDTDAIIVGESGEMIRAGLSWNGALWLGSNRQLHYIAGYGRDSFKTDAAVPLSKAENVLGPGCLIEGPDKLLYGVGDSGLWAFNGAAFDPLHRKLRRFDGRSPGWWDLIWRAGSVSGGFPGNTNGDLIWMAVDWERDQVIVGIPYCDAATGYGQGTDTVLVKYHVHTGGFTRQIFTGVTYTAADYARSHTYRRAMRLLGTPSDGGATKVVRYGYKATPDVSPAMPAALPRVELGPYAQFGPNGSGVYQKLLLTVAWEDGAIPLEFLCTPEVDGQTRESVRLSIGGAQPAAPADGDLWVDMTGTDTNLGNGTAGTIIDASPSDYILRRYVSSWARWVLVPGGGQQHRRVTVPVAFAPARGSRLVMAIETTVATGRFQLEGAGFRPVPVAESV